MLGTPQLPVEAHARAAAERGSGAPYHPPVGRGALTDAERYRFDLQGFLVRPGVLRAREVAGLHEAVDALGVPAPGTSVASQRFSGHLQADARFRALVDHPAVLEVVRETCGPHVRLDHTYGIVMAPGTAGLALHGAGTPFDPAQYYRSDGGRIVTGLVAVQWALVDHPPGGGGFTCIPGSHKAAFPRPAHLDADLAVEVPLRAGDLLVFTEALTHGTSPWRGPGVRRTLLYKYSPGSSAWDDARWPEELLAACTLRQRLLLQPPSVGGHRPVLP
jgi:hypothetical protein